METPKPVRFINFPDDTIFEIVQDDSDIPTSRTQQAEIETAYQNAFKSIEAIIGEPPSDINKLKVVPKTAWLIFLILTILR